MRTAAADVDYRSGQREPAQRDYCDSILSERRSRIRVGIVPRVAPNSRDHVDGKHQPTGFLVSICAHTTRLWAPATRYRDLFPIVARARRSGDALDREREPRAGDNRARR
jgi:hypothetical protein